MELHHPAPICVASPVRRCGTTLLQRLLCSASNTLIYGESCANDLNILASLLQTKQLTLGHGVSERDELLGEVLKGEVNAWIADLMPPVTTYLDSYRESLLHFASRLASYAAAQDRPIWGVKMAEWHPAQLKQLQQVFPGTRIIYLHRRLEDALQSAKRLGLVMSLQDVHHFCQTWQQFSAFAQTHLVGPGILQLAYEDLVAEPRYWLTKLAEFTGSTPLDHAVFRKRINTHLSDPRLQEVKGDYLSPATLTAEEHEVVATYLQSTTK